MISVLISKMIAIYLDLRLTEHALKVYGYAMGIGGEEGLSPDDLKILCMAAVLHDIGIPKAIQIHGSAAGPYQEQEGAELAQEILHSLNVPSDISDRVIWLVGHHHTAAAAKDNLLLQILMEADYLVNMSEKPGRYNHANIRDSFFKTSSGIMYLNNLFFTETSKA